VLVLLCVHGRTVTMV